jgi:predicted permease
MNLRRFSLLRLFRRRRADTELMEEMESHMAEEVAENVARGMTEVEAHRQARIQLGNPAAVRESLWQQNSIEFVDKLARDLRYASRTLMRTPGFSLIAIAVMALCIGASTSLFTIVRSVLLKPLPFRDPNSLVMVYERFRLNHFPIEYDPVSPGDFFDWRSQTNGFQDMAAWAHWPQFNLSGQHGELPEVVHAGAGAWNLFPLLGVQPALGRTFTAAEDRWGADTVVLTWSLYERRFGADRSILGKQIHLDAQTYTVIGVLPRSFNFPNTNVQLWVPYQSITPPAYIHNHAFHQTDVIARLRPDVSLAAAIEQISAVQLRLHAAFPNQAVSESAVPRSLNDDLARDVKKPLLLLICAVGCMLLIGCLNVANLLVARGAARRKEVAIRGALGAQRWTLIREQLMESVLICLAGGVVGVALSVVATQWMIATWKNLPSASGIHIDAEVLAFFCGLMFIAALLAGLMPAISSTGKPVLAALQASARTVGGSLSGTALRKVLLTVEIAATVILLVASGLLLKNFLQLRAIDLRCATDNVLTLAYSLPKAKYNTTNKVIAFHEQLLDRVAAMPGVQATGLGETVPGTGEVEWDVFAITEHPRRPGDELHGALVRRADPGYFRALEIPLLSGRFFTRLDADVEHRGEKVIINHAFAQKHFAGEDPVGKHLKVPLWSDAQYEIIGVVADTLHQVNAPPMPSMFFQALSGSDLDGTLVVRTTGNPLSFAIPVQKQIAALDPELPVSDVLTMRQIIGEWLGDLQLMASLVLAFAVLSLVLASVGLYGVLSYLMTQRTTELGIRMALGAQRQQVLRLMLTDGLKPALAGLGLGLGASVAAGRVVRSLLYDTQPLDATVFVVVAITLLSVAILACMIPAWRASRLDPMQALRTE